MAATPEQLHSALTHCVGFARVMLEKAGEFYPFGAVVNPEGIVEARGAWDGNERPASRDLYGLLASAALTEVQGGRVIAVAIAANVNVPKTYSPKYPDGLRVKLEGEGFSRFIYVPYAVKRAGVFKKSFIVELAEPFAVEAPPEFFPS